jgi:type III restriction enzyme
MELKDYQKHCINEVKIYLEHLAGFRAKYEKALAIDPDMAFDFTRKAWEKAKGGTTLAA